MSPNIITSTGLPVLPNTGFIVIIHSYTSKLNFDLLPRAKEWPHLHSNVVHALINMTNVSLSSLINDTWYKILHILNLISEMLHFQIVRFSKLAIFKMCDFRENRTF